MPRGTPYPSMMVICVGLPVTAEAVNLPWLLPPLRIILVTKTESYQLGLICLTKTAYPGQSSCSGLAVHPVGWADLNGSREAPHKEKLHKGLQPLLRAMAACVVLLIMHCRLGCDSENAAL